MRFSFDGEWENSRLDRVSPFCAVKIFFITTAYYCLTVGKFKKSDAVRAKSSEILDRPIVGGRVSKVIGIISVIYLNYYWVNVSWLNFYFFQLDILVTIKCLKIIINAFVILDV